MGSLIWLAGDLCAVFHGERHPSPLRGASALTRSFAGAVQQSVCYGGRMTFPIPAPKPLWCQASPLASKPDMNLRRYTVSCWRTRRQAGRIERRRAISKAACEIARNA